MSESKEPKAQSGSQESSKPSKSKEPKAQSGSQESPKPSKEPLLPTLKPENKQNHRLQDLVVKISINDDINQSTRNDSVVMALNQTIKDLRNVWLKGIENQGFFTLQGSSLPLEDDYVITNSIKLSCK